MAATSQTKKHLRDYLNDGLSDDCGYNKKFKYSYGIGQYGIGMHCIQKIANICEDRRWGWYFVPTENMNYHSQNWFEEQECFVSFENKEDLLQVIFSVEF